MNFKWNIILLSVLFIQFTACSTHACGHSQIAKNIPDNILRSVSSAKVDQNRILATTKRKIRIFIDYSRNLEFIIRIR